MTQPAASVRLHAIMARLREEGERGQMLRVRRTLRGAAAPLVVSVRAAARERLPRSGGLNEEQASQPISVNVLTGSRSAGVRIRTKTRGSMQTDQGYVRHPIPRNREIWVQQDLPGAAGWWSDTLARGSAAVTPLLIAELNRAGAYIQDGV